MHLAETAYLLISVPGILNKILLISRSRYHPYTTQGFTLIELLVVIVIVAILFSFTLLAIRSDSREDLIKMEAQRFNRLLDIALEEAVLKNAEFGISIEPNAYAFLGYIEHRWQPLQGDKHLSRRELQHDIELELAVEDIDVIIGDATEDTNENDAEDDEDSLQKLKPRIFLLSSEEITPEFSLRFSIPGIETSYTVEGFIDGSHQFNISEL